jgi:hypothetical protein
LPILEHILVEIQKSWFCGRWLESFFDTGALIALEDVNDKNHAEAVTFIDKLWIEKKRLIRCSDH